MTSAKGSLLFPPNAGSRAGALCSRAGTRLRLVQTLLVALVNRRNTPVFLFVVFISDGVWNGAERVTLSLFGVGVCSVLFVYFYHLLSACLSVRILDQVASLSLKTSGVESFFFQGTAFLYGKQAIS